MLAGKAAAAVTSSPIVISCSPEVAAWPPTAAPAGIPQYLSTATAVPHLQCKQTGFRPPQPAAASQPPDVEKPGQDPGPAIAAAPLQQDGAGAAPAAAPSRPPLPPPVPRAAVTRFRRRGGSRLGAAARAAAGPPRPSIQQPTLVLARGVSIISWLPPGDRLHSVSCQVPVCQIRSAWKFMQCNLEIDSIRESAAVALQYQQTSLQAYPTGRGCRGWLLCGSSGVERDAWGRFLDGGSIPAPVSIQLVVSIATCCLHAAVHSNPAHDPNCKWSKKLAVRHVRTPNKDCARSNAAAALTV